ncbi:hypothetical protein ALC53_14022, partial [Atta colombica]
THREGKRFRIATTLRYRWCLPSRNACCLVRTCVLRIEGLPRVRAYITVACEHVLSYYVSLPAASLSSLNQAVQFMSLKYPLIEGQRLPLTPSVIHKSVAVRAGPRRDLLGDSIQPYVIDVISSLGVTVAQLARAPNVYPELPALPEMLVFETTTEYLRYMYLFIYKMSDNEKLKSLYFLRIFTHNYHLTTSLRGKICVRKIGKAIEQRRSIPGRPNKPAKKCNSRLKSQRGNLYCSARCVNRFPFNFYRKSRDADKAVQRSGGGESVPVYVTIATRDHANEYKYHHPCPAMTNPSDTLEPTDKRGELPRCAGDSSSTLNKI